MHTLQKISCGIMSCFLAFSSISVPKAIAFGAETPVASSSAAADTTNGNTATNGTETINTETNGPETKNTENNGTETKNTENNDTETKNTENNGTETKEPAALRDKDVKLSKTAFIYTGVAIKPAVTVTGDSAALVLNKDYTLTYADNTNVGTASVVIQGIDNYTGTVTKTFKISPKDISDMTVKLSKLSYTYNGKAKKPSVKVTSGKTNLKKKTDYTVAYKDNINAGTASATVTGTGNYTGNIKATYTIKVKSLNKFKISLDTATYTYNGSKKKPVVTVKKGKKVLTKNKDFKVKYSDNKKPGVAKVTVTGKGNYNGTLNKNFNINPKRVNFYNIEHEGKKIILTWEKDKTVTGYEICRRDSSGKWKVIKTLSQKSKSYTDSSTGSYGNSYKYRIRSYKTSGSQQVYGAYSKTISAKVQNGTVKINSVTPDASDAFTITWTPQDSADGYYIYRKKNNSSKWKKIKTISSGGTDSYTDDGLKYKATYCYSVRSFRKDGHSKINGKMDKTGYTAKLYFTSKYKDGYKFYYDATGNLIKNVDHIIGKQTSYRLKVNKQANVVTVYAKDGDNGYTIPVKCFLCSCGGANTPAGTFQTPAKYRWHTLDHGVEGQWCTRIHGGVLFHSVWYYSRSKTDLTTVQYNRLGNTASAGCVRVNCASAKWIYDNCSLGTSVTIYTSSDPGPLGKPKATIIPSWHTWDPTDPTCADLCKKRGCH